MKPQPNIDSSHFHDNIASGFKNIGPEIKELSQPVVWRAVTAIMSDWAIITACFLVALSIDSVFIWLLAALIISGRQHALLIIMHDASHSRLFKNKKLGDLVSNLCCSWPLFIETEGFRVNHLPHHRYLNTEKDPDLLRKLEREEEWNFPMSTVQILKLLLRDFMGGGLMDNLQAMKKMGANKKQINDNTSNSDKIGKILYYVLIGAMITYSGLWLAVLLLWLIPAFTLLPVHLRVKAIAEHFGLEGRTEISLTRNYFGPWWERELFYPHNINYHLDHHVFASVPFYNLPKLHELMMKNEQYAEFAQGNSSVFGTSESSVTYETSRIGYPIRGLIQDD